MVGLEDSAHPTVITTVLPGYLLFVGITRNEVGEPPHNVIRLDAFGLGVEVRDDPVPQHRSGHGPDVLARNIIAAMQHRPGFRSEHQGLRASRPRAPGYVGPDK